MEPQKNPSLQQNKATIQQRMKELNKQLRYHNQKYHTEDNPEISDYEYDQLYRELRSLEEKYPQWRLKQSLITSIGGAASKLFETVVHPYPMTSLENGMNEIEIRSFIDRREKDLGRKVKGYSVSLKYDGLAVELIYEKGKLQLGSTRGNGIKGENVTHTLQTIKNIPAQLTTKTPPPKLIVRGEVVMHKEGFVSLNKQRLKEGLDPFAQARSAAAGSVRQLNPTITASRDLHFYAYQIAGIEQLKKEVPATEMSLLSRHTSQLKWLSSMGFQTGKKHFFCPHMKEVIAAYKSCLQEREQLPYEVDGVVIVIDSQQDQTLLGVVGRRPRYAIAWKFPPLIKKTILQQITFQVGRTGVITPVAELKPVVIGGATIRRATLHNKSEILNKDIRIGDWVHVIRSGDVIPKVLSPVVEKRTGKEVRIVFPKTCPSCTKPLIQDKKGTSTLIRCVNEKCPATIETKLFHFVSKEAMNIDGLGKEFIRELIQKQIIRSPLDIYSITAADLDTFDRMGTTLRDKLLDSIQKSKQIRLSNFIYALGIKGVGSTIATKLEKKYDSIQKMFDMQQADLNDIDDIGEVLSQSIVAYFQTPRHQQMIRQMIRQGITFIPAPQVQQTKSAFVGKRLLFTGKLSLPRRIVKQQAEAHGAEIASSISSHVDYLIIGTDPGSKLKQAQQLKIPVLTEKQFYQTITIQKNHT